MSDKFEGLKIVPLGKYDNYITSSKHWLTNKIKKLRH